MLWGAFLALVEVVWASPLDLTEQPGLFLGRWSHDIPIELPPAPRAVVPEIGLSSDLGTVDGPVGMGWTLDGMHRVEGRGATGGAELPGGNMTKVAG